MRIPVSGRPLSDIMHVCVKRCAPKGANGQRLGNWNDMTLTLTLTLTLTSMTLTQKTKVRCEM
jgi:hypothetical protein